jgi:hypothetical protein
MNRLLKLVIFTVFAAAFSVTALAQEVLPVPEYSAESAPRFNSIATYGPASNGEISAMSPLMWEDIGVDSYKITFKIIATGQIITWKPQFMCTPHCMNYEYPTVLFNAVRDGEKVKWWVSAKAGETVFKSAKKTAFVNEIDAVSIMLPQQDAIIPRDNLIYMMWNMLDTAVEYKLVVKNAKTGAVVLKRNLSSNDICSSDQDLCAFVFGGANPSIASVFNHGTPYKWFVVSEGVSGEKAKSPVVQFRTAAISSDK